MDIPFDPARQSRWPRLVESGSGELFDLFKFWRLEQIQQILEEPEDAKLLALTRQLQGGFAFMRYVEETVKTERGKQDG